MSYEPGRIAVHIPNRLMNRRQAISFFRDAFLRDVILRGWYEPTVIPIEKTKREAIYHLVVTRGSEGVCIARLKGMNPDIEAYRIYRAEAMPLHRRAHLFRHQ